MSAAGSSAAIRSMALRRFDSDEAARISPSAQRLSSHSMQNTTSTGSRPSLMLHLSNSINAQDGAAKDASSEKLVMQSPLQRQATHLANHPFSPVTKGYKPFLFNGVQTPTLKRKRSELALRLGGLMSDIDQHESDKAKLSNALSHDKQLSEDGEFLKLPTSGLGDTKKASMSVHIGDWKPFDSKAYQQIKLLNASSAAAAPVSAIAATAAVDESATNESIAEESEHGMMSKLFARVWPSKKPAPATRRQRGHARTRSTTMYEPVTVRTDHRAERCAMLMNTMTYQYVAIAATLLSLYLHDLDLAFFPAGADLPCSIVLCVLMALFAAEIVVSCLVKKNFFLSFYFWLDFIGTVSLLFDITFIYQYIFTSSSSGEITTSTGSAGQISQSASVVRLTRFTRILRVIRLVRIVRLFRYHPPSGSHRHPSKVGLHLSELMDKRVILMVIGMAIIVPYLTADPAADDQSPSLGLEMCVDSSTSASLKIAASTLMATHFNLLYLFVETQALGSNTFVDLRPTPSYSGLRSEEIDIYTDGSSSAMFSLRSTVYLQACYSMATTTLVIAVFMIGSVVITRNVHTLVVAPLERMTGIIRKLAGTVCFLSLSSEEEEAKMSEGIETNVIESTIEKMASIFAVQPSSSSALPKPLQMMAGSKHTEILTNSSVVSIEVIERPREEALEQVIDDGSLSDDKSTWIETGVGASSSSSGSAAIPSSAIPFLQQHREFTNIDTILSTPSLLPYFQMYLSSIFVAENLLFCQEVDRFRSIARNHALNLYNSFVSARAHQQINLNAKEKDAIFQCLSSPRTDMFEAAQRECLELMRTHWRIFLRSKYCRRYLRKKKEQVMKKARMQNRQSQTTARSPIIKVESAEESNEASDVPSFSLAATAASVPISNSTASTSPIKGSAISSIATNSALRSTMLSYKSSTEDDEESDKAAEPSNGDALLQGGATAVQAISGTGDDVDSITQSSSSRQSLLHANNLSARNRSSSQDEDDEQGNDGKHIEQPRKERESSAPLYPGVPS